MDICLGHEESKSVATSAWDSELMQEELQGHCLLLRVDHSSILHYIFDLAMDSLQFDRRSIAECVALTLIQLLATTHLLLLSACSMNMVLFEASAA
jgi:hypothetical protein